MAEEESLGTLRFGVSKSGVFIPFGSKMKQSFVSVKHLCKACLIQVSKKGLIMEACFCNRH